MKKNIVCFVFLLLFSVSFTSCNSCGDTERFVSDAGYGDWDFDGDGEAGRNVNFKGGGASIQNSCNIRSHRCDYGVDRNHDGWCDNCMENGYECHMSDHVN